MQAESAVSSNDQKAIENSTEQAEKHAVDWRLYIHTDPDILAGKPVVKGTRLSVDFILLLFANGWTFKEIFESYPRLSRESLQAVFAYAGESLRDESLFYFPRNPRTPA